MAKSKRLFQARPVVASKEDAAKNADIQESDLSEDQAAVYKGIMQWVNTGYRGKPVLTFGGFAGTGKTTVLGVLADTLGRKGRTAAFCAFTGKATSGLRRKLFSRMHSHLCSTIHSLIYKPILRNGTVTGWARKDQDELTSVVDYIIIDEASMVDAKMLEDLMSYGIPIIAVGDPEQLPPISGTGPMCTEPDLLLSKIHRQAEGNRIIQLSKHVRETGELPTDIEECDEITYTSVAELKEQWLKSHTLVGQDDVMVLTYTNATRCSLNKAIRKWKGLPEDKVVNGDSVIVLRNNGTVFNGMRGSVTRSGSCYGAWQALDVVFPYESMEITAEVLLDQFGRAVTHNDLDVLQAENEDIYTWQDVGLLMDYGYCLTVHKAQGSEARHVYLFNDISKRADKDTRRKWLYTAVTRASEKLYIL